MDYPSNITLPFTIVGYTLVYHVNVMVVISFIAKYINIICYHQRIHLPKSIPCSSITLVF